MPLAVHQTQRVSFAQNFVQDVAQFPRHDSVVHRRQPQGYRPERLSPLLMEGADDRRTHMLLLDRRFAAVYGLVYGNRLKNDGSF